MTAPDEFLAPIRERLATATPGPWKANEDGTIDGSNYDEVICKGQVDCMSYCYGGSSVIEGDNLKADAEFIAHSPETQARLLAALDGVLALHSVDTHECECGEVHGPFCSECVGESWPCPTVAAVTTGLEGQG